MVSKSMGGAPLIRSDSAASSTSVSSYWFRFPNFVPRPTDTLAEEFNRLSLEQGWSKGHKKQKKRRAECYGEEFAAHFENNKASKLENWQGLCEEVGIDPVPTTITQCKKALNGTMVNLVNLLDHRRNPNIPLRKFASFNEFRKFTKDDNIFPKELAKREGFIKALLAHIQ